MAEELHKRGMHYVIITVRASSLLEYFHFNVDCNVYPCFISMDYLYNLVPNRTKMLSSKKVSASHTF